jgi:hypothetical protein
MKTCGKEKSDKRQPRLLLVFFALLGMAVFHPAPVFAQTCCPTGTTPANPMYVQSVPQDPQWLAQIGDMVKSISWLVDLFNGLTQGTSRLGGTIVASAQNTVGAFADTIQGVVDGGRLDINVNFASHSAAEMALSPNTTACSVNASSIYHVQSENAKDAAVATFEAQNVQGNKGVNANNGPALISEKVKDLCALGFINSSEYGSLPQTMSCQPDKNYVDADELLTSLLGQLQYPIPGGAAVAGDNTLLFAVAPSGATSLGTGVSTTPQPAGGAGKVGAKNWIAAYEFCMHLPRHMPTPAFGSGSRSVTSSDYQSIYTDRDETARAEGPQAECMESLLYRTACPSTSASLFTYVGLPSTCHDMQVAMCNTIQNDPSAGGGPQQITGGPAVPQAIISNTNADGTLPPGYGIQDDPALTNCQTDGLSLAMADHILANRCASRTYMQKVLPSILSNASKVEEVGQFDCQYLRDNFHAQLERERQRILTSLETLALMRENGEASYNSISRPMQSGQ